MSSFRNVRATVLLGGTLVAFPTAARQSPLQVAVSVPPQAYLVERIAGDAVQVEVMIPKGHSPATYEPSVQQRQALARARIYVMVGHPSFPFETRHLPSLLHPRPDLEVIDMTRAIELPSASDDPHVWLAPSAMRATARDLERALSRLDPAGAAHYRAGLQHFLRDVQRLDGEIRATLSQLEHRRFVVSHPAWGYFAREYGLEQVSIETEGKEPTPKRLVELVRELRREGCRVLFVQPGFPHRATTAVARELGVEVVVLDPLVHDWIENLRAVAHVLASALRP